MRRRDIYKDIAWCETFLPYCAQRETSTGHILLLDRRYKELWVRAYTPKAWAALRRMALIDRNNGVYVHFWNDAAPPWVDAENRARCLGVLDMWGVPIIDRKTRKVAAPVRRAAFERWGRGVGGVPTARCWLT